MKFKVKMTIKAILVEAENEDSAIEKAWSEVADNVPEFVTAKVKQDG